MPKPIPLKWLLVIGMLFRGAVESDDGLVSSNCCGNHTDIRSIVPKRPRPTSPMHHQSHWIIVATYVVFLLPNSRLYHNQRNLNTPVLVDERFDQAVDVATMFTCTLFSPHRICSVYRAYTVCESVSLLMTMLISMYFVVDHFMIVSIYSYFMKL